MFKSQAVCRGAKTVFSQNCRDVKNEVFKQKMVFWVFAFFVFEKVKTEKKKKTNEICKNAQKIVCFGVAGEKNEFFNNGIF